MAILLVPHSFLLPLVRYKDLVDSQEGREILMRSLVENINESVEESGPNAKLEFTLPPSLGGPLIDVRSSDGCCKLKEVPFKYRNGVYTQEIIDTVLEMNGVKEYSKGEDLDHSNKDVNKAVEKVADIINGDQRPFEDMLSLAAATKNLVNENIYAKAIELVTLRRTDVSFKNPPEQEPDYEDNIFDEVVIVTTAPVEMENSEFEQESENLSEKAKFWNEKEKLIAEKERRIIEKEQLLNEKLKLLGEKEKVLDEKETVLKEKEIFLTEREHAIKI